jgi:hypothetical protein
MFAGIENLILGNRSASSGTEQAASTQQNSPKNQILESVSTVSKSLGDLVDLSSEARARLENDRDALNNLAQGRGELARNEVNNLNSRLDQIAEQLDTLGRLLSQASPEQSRSIISGLEQVGDNLEQIGRQLGLVQGAAPVDSARTSITAGTLSASFNGVVEITNENGQVARFSETLNVEFSFLNIENETQSGDTTQSVSLNASSLSVTSEKSLEIYGNLSRAPQLDFTQDPLASTLQKFQALGKSFQQVIQEFDEQVTSDDRIPPSIFNQMKMLLEASLID